MQKVIIMDGVDGCYKSTMAKELSKRLNIPYFKNSRQDLYFGKDSKYFQRALKFGEPYFCDYLKQSGASIIIDRGYPSEFCYPHVMGRETDIEMLRIVDEMFAGIDTKIVCPFRSDYSVVKDKFEVLDKQKLEAIHEMYAQFCRWTKCDVLRFCVDGTDIETQMALIIPFVQGASDDAQRS